MLMTFAIESFVLNVTGLLEWTLKHIDKCRIGQTRQKNIKTKYQMYSNLTINSPEKCHLLLLLILNIFCT